jgi:hypothetical protein
MFRKLFGFLAVACLLCASVVLADEIKGKITKVDPDKKMLTISVDGKETEYMVSDDCKMPVRKGKDGTERAATLKGLAGQADKAKDRGGITATIITEKKGGKEVVTEIKTGGRPKGGDK